MLIFSFNGNERNIIIPCQINRQCKNNICVKSQIQCLMNEDDVWLKDNTENLNFERSNNNLEFKDSDNFKSRRNIPRIIKAENNSVYCDSTLLFNFEGEVKDFKFNGKSIALITIDNLGKNILHWTNNYLKKKITKISIPDNCRFAIEDNKLFARFNSYCE